MDPHVESLVVRGRDVPRIEDLKEAVGLADIVVLLQPQDEFLASGALFAADCILDTSGRVIAENVDRL